MATPTARLISMPTRAELLASDEMIEVYVAEIPKKRASLVLSAIKSIPGQNDTPLQHLRRFAKADFVPERVRALTSTTSSCSLSLTPEIMHVLLCPTDLIAQQELADLIDRTLLNFRPVKVVSTPVPLYAPTSLDQAAAKSAAYWPTIFMNSNTFGPHPTILARATAEMEASATATMQLAHAVGLDARDRGLGCGCGVVVIERTAENPKGNVVAVAGDGRWMGLKVESGAGQVGSHAVMRALALVARKRRQIAGMTKYDATDSGKIFAGDALTPVEQDYFGKGELLPNGYLCLNLEVWVTHEPCTMCSMALLHSRCSRVIFGRRMVKTGAMRINSLPDSPRVGGSHGRKLDTSRLTATSTGLDYGVFWRDDLNWRFLCWQLQDDETTGAEIDEETHV